MTRTRRREREALLERLVGLFSGDSRFVAAFLTGSLGRGAGDDLSDLDLWTVAEDADLRTLRGCCEEVRALMAGDLLDAAAGLDAAAEVERFLTRLSAATAKGSPT
jgi:predicted nucleotidyltransferase